MENEQWKSDILNSLEGISRAEPNPALLDRIKEKISGLQPLSVQVQLVPRSYIALVAASLALLITANVMLVSQSRNEVPTSAVDQLEGANFDLYQ